MIRTAGALPELATIRRVVALSRESWAGLSSALSFLARTPSFDASAPSTVPTEIELESAEAAPTLVPGVTWADTVDLTRLSD
ncbi:MAG TPA: hypothetical protein VM848_10255 [Acidimicrobiia bacterium]|nr:hypothetical protein [Acidimicrobiia bacterium]